MNRVCLFKAASALLASDSLSLSRKWSRFQSVPYGMKTQFRMEVSMSTMSGIKWATVDPNTLSGRAPYTMPNLVQGAWTSTQEYDDIPDPLTGETFLRVPRTSLDELAPFRESLQSCPKTGLHNLYKKPERYLMWGDVSAKAAEELRKPEVEDFFVRLIQRVVPKSYAQALGEVRITRIFLQNFSGDQVRNLAEGFSIPGDHLGQVSHGLRWPWGPVALITPFNFPLEIVSLQLMGALYMGNKVVTKNSSPTALVTEQYLRLLHHCGAPMEDVDLISSDGPVMGELLKEPALRMTQFTGSSKTAEHLAKQLHGKIKIEDAGFDWKILGPDLQNVDYIAWQCDQDAYACTGQKCSAQSILFMHENWKDSGLLEKMKALAARRNLQDLTVGPVLTQTTQRMLDHCSALLKIPGARLLFGGEELQGGDHSIPPCYGAIQPTAVFVPLSEILKPENFSLCTTEIFGPFQVVTEYGSDELPLVLEACERMDHHLTAAVVSNDPDFQIQVLGNTVNGTTYVGARARTTGAPQNHWFGPAGDPRGAGIGTREAIQLVWSCHREVIVDAAMPKDWTTPQAT